MALLILNAKTLTLDVKVGVLEEYKPDKEIKAISRDVDELRKLISDKIVEIIGEKKTPSEVAAILGADKDKAEQWQLFLKGDFGKNLAKINERIKSKNIKICPKFEEFIKK